jgi:hypothetical protein
VGIYAYGSGAGSHQIYNNSFGNLEQGISAIGDNSGGSNLTDGLKMNCNDFTTVTNKYDITMLNSSFTWGNVSYPVYATVKAVQGKIQSVSSVYDLVRNRYAANSACSTCENRWYIDGTSFRTVKHGSNASSSSNTHPIPQPQNSDVAVNDVASSYAFQSSHCPENPGALDGASTSGSKPVALNNYLGALIANHSSENDLSYDIQATLAEKMAYFAADSSDTGVDTIIAMLNNYGSFIKNADVLKVYAYLHKGDYDGASEAATQLSDENADWKDLLDLQINLAQNENKTYGLNGYSAIELLNNLAVNDTAHGHAAAQTILQIAQNSNFT